MRNIFGAFLATLGATAALYFLILALSCTPVAVLDGGKCFTSFHPLILVFIFSLGMMVIGWIISE